MKIGIYGGSFNPIHKGHENIIKYVMSKKKLDKIIVIPVGNPSHREGLISGGIRIEMARTVCDKIKGVEVSDIEVREEGISYTYDTFLKLREIYKGAQFYEIIGEDSADYLHSWKSYEKMVEEVKFLVLKRRGYTYEAVHKNIEVLESPIFPYSSTEVREAIADRRDTSSMLSDEVRELVEKYRLYEDREA